MKTLIFIVLLILLPFCFVNAQNDQTPDTKTVKVYTIEWKKVSCPDCLGWGWLIGEGFKNNTSNSWSNNANNPSKQRNVSNCGMERYLCMNCNGSGKIYIKYYKNKL